MSATSLKKLRLPPGEEGCHDALRVAQKIVDDGYIYVVDLDLERFFDTVSHSKLIEILSRTIKDGRGDKPYPQISPQWCDEQRCVRYK